MFQQAVRIRRGARGRDHADVAISLVKVGVVQLLLRQFDEALFSFREALSTRRHALGHLHPSTARIYNNIGCVHIEFNEIREARRAFEAALDIQRDALCHEPDNLQMSFSAATTLCNLAYLYAHRGMHSKASLVLKEAMNLQEKVIGRYHPTALSTLDCLADSYSQSGDFQKATICYKDLAIRIEKRGDDEFGPKQRKQRALGITYYKMGRIYQKQNDFEAVVKMLKHSSLYVRELGSPELLKNIEEEIKKAEAKISSNMMDWL
jgi:tetratricopeptide (TPR) repeat protein